MPQQKPYSSTLYPSGRVCRLESQCRCARATCKFTAVTSYCCAQPCDTQTLESSVCLLNSATCTTGVWATVVSFIGRADSHSWLKCESTTDSRNCLHWLHTREELNIAPAAGANLSVVVQCCTQYHALGVAWVATLVLSADCKILRRGCARNKWWVHWHTHAQPSFRSSSELCVVLSCRRRRVLLRPPLTYSLTVIVVSRLAITIIHLPA